MSYKKEIFLFILTIPLGIGFLWLVEPTPKMKKLEEMKVICYSCGRGENPENTILGIQHCLNTDSTWRIEMDIQRTKDGILVLFHDYEVKRITGIDGRIDELTFKEIEKLNAGFNFQSGNEFIYRDNPIQIPRLETVFQKFPDANFMLDIHTDNMIAVNEVIDLVEKYGHEKTTIIASHYDKIIQQFKKERRDWKYGVPTNEAKKMVYSSFLYLDGFFPIKSDILMLPQKFGKIEVLSSRVVNHAKNREKEIWAWLYEGEYVKNVDTREELEMLGKIGIDGVFTDYPEKLKSELR